MPVLQETHLGWIISGNLCLDNAVKQTICSLATRITNKDLHDSLTKFWRIEEFGKEDILSEEERYCEDYFKNTTVRDKEGRFVVKYPFKQKFKDKLGDSKTLAEKRFKNLEQRLRKNEVLKNQYVEFIQNYENLVHMSFVCNLESDNSIEEESFFLPHTAVLRESVTTKCRVVFDASAKSSNGTSFNDLILVGPTIQDELFSILLRVRLRTIVLSADIKMMYRGILIEPSERCYQQIIWRKDPNEPLNVYRLNTVTYGTSSAPFQATRCLKELAEINKNKYPRTARIIENSFYMDDLLVSVNSEQEALEVYRELTEILSQAKFKLRKWSSNDKNILDHILQNDQYNEESLVLLHDERELKTLGIAWNANEDVIKYLPKIEFNESRITKRTILATVSQIFDPLGLVGPVIIKAKLIIQELWHLKIDWDQEIPLHLKEIWLGFISQLHMLKLIEINRLVLVPNACNVELYGFCDSSEKAYGACIYLSSINANNERAIRLLTAKSKVAPIKNQTLPRLELQAAYLLAKLVHRVKDILDIEFSKLTYFSDSTIVLAWLKIEPCNLKTFVANRVAKIIEISNISEWKHVRSQDNAADIISRGLSPQELINNEMWFHGPQFLKNETYKFDEEDEYDIDNLPEIKLRNISVTVTEKVTNEIDIFQKYSTFSKLLKVVAYILRFRNRTLTKVQFLSKVLTADELNEARLILVKLAQNEVFKREISDLKSSGTVNNNSKLCNLHPFLDSENVLRVGGRLSNADVDFDQKHPIVLPYKHKLTDLIILDTHLKYMHVGTQNLLSILRLRYWPIKGKDAVKRVLKSCIRCYRANPKAGKFLMGELPQHRVKPSRPFTNCGIDYAGPILVKESGQRRSKLVKTYIGIFVCFATRAVHIELATDLTTNSFLNVLKRFCSRRGKPRNIYSDNGLNFVGAHNSFQELYRLLNDNLHNTTVSSFLAEDQITWHFIPARSPHVGGLWEAAVKSMKFHLKRVLGDCSLKYEEMYTLIVQIEACLNSRPLSPISNDVHDFLPLSPAHFLIGDSLASCPEEDLREVNTSRLSRYQRLQQLYQQYWNRWSRDYLTTLQTRSKWKKDTKNPVQEGALVVLVEDNMPPLRWPMARIHELHPGAVNIVRIVSVRLPNGTILRRSLTKVFLLPINADENDD